MEKSKQSIDLARMNIYQFLSHAFLYPEEELYSSLKEQGFARELKTCFKSLSNIPLNTIAEQVDCLCSSVVNMSLEDMQSEFCRIFGHTISTECPPYETEYGKAHVFQQSQSLGDISGFYKAFGLEASDKIRERPDYISTELEFMYFLIFKENFAREHNKTEEAEICYDAQKKFLKEHLGTWIPLFVQFLSKKAGKGFYRMLASLTENFLRSEVEFFKVKPEEIKELGSFKEDQDGIYSPCDSGGIKA